MEGQLDGTLLRESIERLAEDLGLLLVDLNWYQSGRRGSLRILVDRPGRVTVGECASLSRAIEDYMDRELIDAGSYILEVSSPGIGRRLETETDWKRCVGRVIKVETESETVEDELLSFEGGCLVFPESRIVPVSMITRAVETIETGGTRGKKA